MSLQEREPPRPGPQELLLRVRACGICGTDQHLYHGHPGSAAVQYPRVLGHELAGEVVAVGEAVHGWRCGERVTVDPNLFCGHCRYCRSGRAHLCDHLQAVGVTRDGGFAEYCTVPASHCYRLPDNLSYTDGALLEPLGCCLHGLEQLHLAPGQSAVVLGAGFIGLLMAQLLCWQGLDPVWVSDPAPSKRALVASIPGAVAVDPQVVSLTATVSQWPGGGADVVVECVGRAETMQQAVELAGKGGQVLLFGVAPPEAQAMFSPFRVFARELTLHGSFINPYTHPRAMALAASGRIHLSRWVSHPLTLTELPHAMDRLPAWQAVKAMVTFTD
ncbi:MAG: zinc-dependent alcohol dehydrogenase family protein [Alicyclobacillus sp.]|nr:zinc-dependent alcohol dehydrogenase family protein [Alicyclobacillus sp.]